MKILQVASSLGLPCGIALFATRLQAQLHRAGIHVDTVDRVPSEITADVILLQHHEELDAEMDVAALVATCGRPVILFAHSETAYTSHPALSGIVTMCPGMVESTIRPVHVFPHPAWTPSRLEDRPALRREFGLPDRAVVVGTNGFLRFERQFVEIIEALLPDARREGWFIELLTSPWRLDSPGLISRLDIIRRRFPEHFRFHHAFLDEQTLNRRLQACNLLWCWTDAPSSPYASGTISDQYASGTRVVATDKIQHQHVLGLPNTVAAPASLAAFIDTLVSELRDRPEDRHDPAPVSWDRCITDLAAFIRGIDSAS